MAAKDEVRKSKKKFPHTPPSLGTRDDHAETSTEEAAEHFVRGVVTRGEAAKAVDGELPPGATHEIVEEKPGELPIIKRRRFSMF